MNNIFKYIKKQIIWSVKCKKWDNYDKLTLFNICILVLDGSELNCKQKMRSLKKKGKKNNFYKNVNKLHGSVYRDTTNMQYK